MANIPLPFYKEFFFTIENNEISEWEAKKFICKILKYEVPTAKKKQSVYKGINILVRCGYFLRRVNPKNKRTFLYTETMKSKNYRQFRRNEKIGAILNKKLSEIIEKIEEKNLELVFLDGLITEFPLLENSLESTSKNESTILKELVLHKKFLLKLIDNNDLMRD